MALTIGIVIPCFKPHIPFLIELLNSIQNQTRLPDQVVVSCSSTEESDIPNDLKYTFPFQIYWHTNKMNAAQNRNFGVSKLTTDIICFIDADDTMYPQKIEIVEKCFSENNSVMLLHNFENFTGDFVNYSDYPLHFNKFSVCPWGSVIHSDGTHFMTCNSQISVRREVFDNIKFKEESQFHAREDTVFAADVINMFSNRTAYCPLSLTKYRHSQTMNTFTFD